MRQILGEREICLPLPAPRIRSSRARRITSRGNMFAFISRPVFHFPQVPLNNRICNPARRGHGSGQTIRLRIPFEFRSVGAFRRNALIHILNPQRRDSPSPKPRGGGRGVGLASCGRLTEGRQYECDSTTTLDLPPVIYGGTEGGKPSPRYLRGDRGGVNQPRGWRPDTPMSEKSFPSDTHVRSGSDTMPPPSRMFPGDSPCADRHAWQNRGQIPRT